MKWCLICLLFAGCARQPLMECPYEIPEVWHTDISETPLVESECLPAFWEALNDPALTYLIEQAGAQNLDLQIAATRVLQARTEANGKSGDLFPSIDASFTCGRVSYNKKAIENILVRRNCLGNSRFNFFEIGFDAEWELDFFGMKTHEINALVAHEKGTEEELSLVFVTLSGEIAKTYVELRNLQNRQALLLKKRDLQLSNIEQLETLENRGLEDIRALPLAKSTLSKLDAELSSFEQDIGAAIRRLSILIGQAPGHLFSYLETCQTLPEIPCALPIGLPSSLLQRRPDIRKAEYALEEALERTESAIAALYPRFSLWGFAGNINQRAGSLFNSSSFTWAAGPQILLPIFNSKLLLQDVEYNNLSTQEALLRYQKTVLEALEEAENAISAYLNELKRSRYLDQSYRLVYSAQENDERLYQRGLISRLALIHAEQETLEAAESALQGKAALLFRYIALYKALGGSWDAPCQ